LARPTLNAEIKIRKATSDLRYEVVAGVINNHQEESNINSIDISGDAGISGGGASDSVDSESILVHAIIQWRSTAAGISQRCHLLQVRLFSVSVKAITRTSPS
jgi:hypothetical protein